TAVVGPNGCGKSNIFDSIRWVLGELSVKSLRGSDMQDVIFNGTDAKEALSMAEVSLAFDNSNKFFAFDAEEVVITRRLFRSGESEYLLNKNIVRLKDVLDLLMGTGIGAESYSLIAQGKIDLVLSSRPEERRMVFDEASGITKYKTQKREAMRKLEETAQNLLRVNDIIVEVKRQIGSLERQATKARRYREVFEELKFKEIQLALAQHGILRKEKDEIIASLSSLEEQELRLMEEIREQEEKIANRQREIKELEINVMAAKNVILGLDNSVVRNKERIAFDREKIIELESTHVYLEKQLTQVADKLKQEEEKLASVRCEYEAIKKISDDKKLLLQTKEKELECVVQALKVSSQAIADAKNAILELATKIANTNNEINEMLMRQQTFLARKKRLELEKAKTHEEKSSQEEHLATITSELEIMNKEHEEFSLAVNQMKAQAEQEDTSLKAIIEAIQDLEKQVLTLLSHKDFIEKLKTTYEGIGESLNATVYIDKMPAGALTGLVFKVHSTENDGLKLTGEAKPVDLDTQSILAKIESIQQEITTLVIARAAKESNLAHTKQVIEEQAAKLREQDIALANKRTVYQSCAAQFNKIKEEEEIILLEVADLDKELNELDTQLSGRKIVLSQLESEQKHSEDSINNEQLVIAQQSMLKEQTLVLIAQTRAEIESLVKKVSSDEATLKLVTETYERDKESLSTLERQMQDACEKKELLLKEIIDSEHAIQETEVLIEQQRAILIQREQAYQLLADSASEVLTKIDADRRQHDTLKNRLYELQMSNKDVDYKLQTLKERMASGYKVDIDTVEQAGENIDNETLAQEVQKLKEKLDGYGTVNLVAIEEYDELKKRYDFLIQQQTDLTTAKDSLHEAIAKINRTTRKMFLETFELVKQEFRNYFRMLFNGGDAQLFLIDEQDPLESGIEIICRPPGKKLQNVLLLSGGEKAMSAIALIFAIFKVKPSPFCILDEIDAALDEANVDRFGRMLTDFTQTSQFIVITHNKKTIANADVMYGITMEESGVSKIVSVKFSKEKKSQDTQTQTLSEPAPV
ncbi:MAG: AAA family ATPase, partial [Candidatus Omnitrophica bacterium]|nr:AAA family ATPase [Candidatus Omnitrophota bacterium]